MPIISNVKKSLVLVTLLTLFVLAVAAGCKSSALNDAGQAEKQKEQGAISDRANAEQKVLGNSSGN